MTPAVPVYSGSYLPICVDLDGTLIRSDLLAESFLSAVRRRPWVIFLALMWFMRGRAALKARLSECCDLDPVLLPYNRDIIDYLTTQKRAGHKLYLTTGSHYQLARAVARHLDLFDDLLATADFGVNLTGTHKLCGIQQLLGNQPFLYAGNSRADLVIWRHSAGAIAVNTSPSLARSLGREGIRVIAAFPAQASRLRLWLREARVYQWSKNVLIFAPLLLSHRINSLGTLRNSVLAFVALSMCASAGYVFNDLMDLSADRAHSLKRSRPLAAGDLTIYDGIALLASMSAAAAGLAFLLPPAGRVLLALYALITVAYSGRLKRILFLDVLVLAFLYTLRILFGGAAEQITVSVWTIAFSLFLFLGLALVKRLTELVGNKHHIAIPSGRRAYISEDVSVIRSLAAAALYLSVLVLAMYINSPEVLELYRHPAMLWLVCLPLIYWISRLLLLANRGCLTDDAIVFAASDRTSYVVLAVVIACIAIAV